MNDAFSGVRTGLERLRFAGRFPTGGGDLAQHRVKVIDSQCDVDRSDVARPKIDMLFAIRRSKIFEQLDFVSAGRFHNREFDFSARYAGDFAGQFACLMRAMRKLKSEHILPEGERTLEI